MSFDARRALFAGLVFLVGIGVSFAEDSSPQQIEVIPSHGKTVVTPNSSQSQPVEEKNFNKLFPSAPHTFLPDTSQEGITMSPPQKTVTPSQQEKELLDRRRNWVFTTAEDLMQNTDPSKALGIKEYDKNGQEKKPATAIERFYQRLYDADHQTATNGLSQSDSNPWAKATNSATGEPGEDRDSHVFDSPFDKRPESGVFDVDRENTFSAIFGSSSDTAQPDPEVIRAREAQQARLETFKQIWNIGQPTPVPASPFTSSGDSPSASAPVQSAQTAFGSSGSPASSSPSQANSATQPVVTSSRMPPPPTFAIPQRRF